MDSQDIAFAFAASCAPAVVWAFCGALIAVIKSTLVEIKSTDATQTQNSEISPKASVPATSFVLYITGVLFDLVALLADTALNVARTALSYTFVIFFFIFCCGVSYLLLEHNAKIIFVVDTLYEILRPNLIETVLQVLNFARTVFAIFVGIWNASVEILMLPFRVLFDSAYGCARIEFLQDLTFAGVRLIKEFVSVLSTLFANWRSNDVFEADITLLVHQFRKFLHVFIDIIECSCESLNIGDITRVVAHPIWTNATDVLANSAAVVVLKGLQVPYDAMSSGSTSFGDLFDAILVDDSGFLSSAATLGNDYLNAVTDFVQSPLSKANRFTAPPVFSLVHRNVALYVELVKIGVNTAAALPVLFATLIDGQGQSVANKAYVVTSTQGVKHQFNQFFDVLFVQIIGSFHSSWAQYGQLFTGLSRSYAESCQLAFNFTRSAAVGLAEQEYKIAPFRRFDSVECATRAEYASFLRLGDRIRYAGISASDRYSALVVPIQQDTANSLRAVMVDKLLATAVAESAYAALLALIHFYDGYWKTVSYLMDSLLSIQYVSLFCLQDFQAPAWEKIDDFIVSLPNIITSFTAMDETNDSGYSNLVCARSTHVNHIYSGSLKAYIFASKACRVQYDGSNVYPKCSYRDPDSTKQALLCSQLVAFADYNTNPFCALGDVLVHMAKTVVTDSRTLAEYQMGMQVAIFNCLAQTAIDTGAGRISSNSVVSCASSLGEELVPSSAVYDLLECHTAELVYRTAGFAVSMWSPLFDILYARVQYPPDGYYTNGIDGVEHVQARPIEAALTTLLTSTLGGVFFFPIHLVADNGRELTEIFRNMAKGSFDITVFHKYRYQVTVNSVRSTILFWRDVLIGILEFARSAETVANYERQTRVCTDSAEARSDPNLCPANPRIVSTAFVVVHRVTSKLVGMIQAIADLVSEAFILGVEKFFDLFLSLVDGLLSMDPSKIQKFFQQFLEAIFHVFFDMLNGVFTLIIADFPEECDANGKCKKSNLINPFRFLFCDVLGSLKDGVCDFIKLKFIPQKFSIDCLGDRKGCTWLPTGEFEFFSATTLGTGLIYGQGVEDVDWRRGPNGQVLSMDSADPVKMVANTSNAALKQLGFRYDPMFGEFLTSNGVRAPAYYMNPLDTQTAPQSKYDEGGYWNDRDDRDQVAPGFTNPKYDPSNPNADVKRYHTREGGGWIQTPLEVDNTIPERSSDYDYCPYYQNQDLCVDNGILSADDIDPDPRIFYGTKRELCERPKRPDAYSNIEGFEQVSRYTQMCQWVPEPGKGRAAPKARVPKDYRIWESTFPKSVKFAGYASLEFHDDGLSGWLNDEGQWQKRYGTDGQGNNEFYIMDWIDLLAIRPVKLWIDDAFSSFEDRPVFGQLTDPGNNQHYNNVAPNYVDIYKGSCKRLTDTLPTGYAQVESNIVNIGGIDTELFTRVLLKNPEVPAGGLINLDHIFGECNISPPPSPPRPNRPPSYQTRRLNVFKEAMEEKDPEKRRQLLGGVRDGIVDAANSVAKKATYLANSAKRLANQAKNAVVKAANSAANIVDDVVDWVEDTVDKIKESIPLGGFSLQTASIADAAKLTGDTLDKMQCNQDSFAQCSNTFAPGGQSLEPTVCNREADCEAANSTCWTPDEAQCEDPEYDKNSENWAKACSCSRLRNDFHCNFASGYCQAGLSPFKEPLTSCGDAEGLVFGSAGYNRLCYISPVWMCASDPNPDTCRERRIGADIKLQGPSLCRSFCDPTFENRNNHLTEYRFNSNIKQCVCEVGVDRVFPQREKPREGQSTAGYVTIITPFSAAESHINPIIGRRKLLALYSSNTSEPSPNSGTSPFTACSRSNDCAPSFARPSLCRSLWGTPVPCYSCSERIHGESATGYTCNPEDKECACTVIRDLDYGDPSLVDIGDWQGNSFCDKVMRGYKTSALRSPLERAWIHKCSVLKGLGQTIVAVLGLPTVPPDVLYNPSRVLSVAMDAVQGVHTYYSENFSREDVDDRIEFFDRLIEKRIDPLVTLTALNAFMRVYDAVRIIVDSFDGVGIARSLLQNVDPNTRALFEEGMEQTAPVVNEIIQTIRETNYSTMLLGIVSSAKTVHNLTSTMLQNGTLSHVITAAVQRTPNLTNIVHVEGIVTNNAWENSTRRLLSVAKFSEQCAILKNLKNRVQNISTVLSRYYGDNEGYLSATLCSFDHYSNGRNCLQVKGQSKGQGIDPSDAFPKLGVNVTTFSLASLIQSAEKADTWFLKNTTAQTNAILSLSSNVEGVAIGCDAEVLLCNRRKHSLASAAFVVEFWALVIFGLLSLTGFSSFGLGLFLTAQFTVLAPLIMKLSYDYPMTCLPRLPVCLGDDLFDLVVTVFPRHILWPSALVQHAQRRSPDEQILPWLQQLDEETSIVDCGDHGFNLFFDAIFWFREYLQTDWFQIVEYPLVRFVSSARTASRKWRNIQLTAVINQCGIINAPGVIPPLVIAFFVYVSLSFIAVPGVRVGARAFAGALPALKNIVLAILDIYNR